MSSLEYTAGSRFARPSEVIIRLRETRGLVSLTSSDFAVIGVGEFQKAAESGDFLGNRKAALYVLCGNSSSALITDAGLASNEVLHTIDIVLCLRMNDNRAQYSDQVSVWFKEYLCRSLIGYEPYTGAQPLTFGGDVFNNTANVASYLRTYQFAQRVFVDGSDLIGNDPSDLDDLTQIYNELNAIAPDFGETTP
jgi:hypothetical protein